MPHLLVAGTTGSGKSVGVNAMILSMLYKAQPEDVRFIMIDPKMLELSVYEGIPHLLTEVVTDMKDAANALRWCVNEMERRYKLMSALGVRNLAGYNEKIAEADRMMRPIPDPYWKPGDSMDAQHPVLKKEPYIVVLVDEFADLMMTVGKKVEELIARLAQKARAAGIHLVLATQRPSVDVITGLIKANIPTRIAFTVSSKIDSRTILDQAGAESLLGMGDMLYSGPNSTLRYVSMVLLFAIRKFMPWCRTGKRVVAHSMLMASPPTVKAKVAWAVSMALKNWIRCSIRRCSLSLKNAKRQFLAYSVSSALVITVQRVLSNRWKRRGLSANRGTTEIVKCWPHRHLTN